MLQRQAAAAQLVAGSVADFLALKASAAIPGSTAALSCRSDVQDEPSRRAQALVDLRADAGALIRLLREGPPHERGVDDAARTRALVARSAVPEMPVEDEDAARRSQHLDLCRMQ